MGPAAVGGVEEVVCFGIPVQAMIETDMLRCLFNTFLVVSQISIGVTFIGFMYSGRYRVSGFLEWTLTYLGCFWLLSFIGYTK
jgi:hypothetical protein